MKKILLILSLMVLMLSCQQKNTPESNGKTKEPEPLFFASDSTILGAIQARQSIATKDSLLEIMGFVKKDACWEKDHLKFFHLTDRAFKIIVEDDKWVKEISQKIGVLPINKTSKNFLFGIQMKRGQPFQEVFFTLKNERWELKVFPRNRL